MALPLHTHAKVQGLASDRLYKVLRLDEALQGATSYGSVVVLTDEYPETEPMLLRHGFAGVVRRGSALPPDASGISAFDNADVVGGGDVIRVKSSSGMVSVLYRRGANANSLFVTERCNSLCRMCSQPPRQQDDTWRVAELLQLIELIDPSLPILGVTGGEPTLLGDNLVRILNACGQQLPNTAIHILSNGRTFSDARQAAQFYRASPKATWGIPIYSDLADAHDYVTGAAGSFTETVNGLLNMAEHGGQIELRVVLHALTINRLPALAQFIARNFPFVRHVALMGLEPMGLAKRNMAELWIDPTDYADVLADTVEDLDAVGLPVSIYNVPVRRQHP